VSRQVCSLNTSASALLTKLRLTPQAASSRRAEGLNTEQGFAISDNPLIGGAAVRSNGRY
jgi:hypothetical protein